MTRITYSRTMHTGGHTPTNTSFIELGDGSIGVLDPRYVNRFGRFRRITGHRASRMIAAAADRICTGIPAHGRMDWNAHEIPLDIINRIEPLLTSETPKATWI